MDVCIISMLTFYRKWDNRDTRQQVKPENICKLRIFGWAT